MSQRHRHLLPESHVHLRRDRRRALHRLTRADKSTRKEAAMRAFPLIGGAFTT